MTPRSPRGRIGSTIRDKYRVDTFIATGSMANVYAATHRNGGRVALKILHRELASDPQMRERFKREGYFCNAIDHPAIAKAIDDDVTDDDCPYIVMELLDGENLEVRRKRIGGRIPLGEVLTVADGVLDVLAAAHEKGILHRDLKPENVFLTSDGNVKLLDFGVARWNDGKTSSEVTGVGMVLGTPAFMPPEQALGMREEVDPRSDLWALGATLFTLLTGESVHTGDTAKAKLVATATKPARKLREVLPNVPTAVSSVIDRALEYHRTERWDDANAMREALRWARMSQDPEAGVMTSSSPMKAAANIDTARRVRSSTDDEPTVMRKALSDEEVFTSAPPVTARSTSASTPRATIPDDTPPALSDSGESIAFSLRNDPVFSLRRAPEKSDEKKKESDRPPSTQRLPGGEAADPLAATDATDALDPNDLTDPNGKTDENYLGLPPLAGSEGPISEDIRMEYTRPIMVPAGFRGTLPLSGQKASDVAPIPTPAQGHASAPPLLPISSQLHAAPAPSNTGTKVFLTLVLLAMLGGTVAVLWMRSQPHAQPHPPAAAIVQTPSPALSQSATAAPSAEPPAAASAADTAEPAASASAAPSATATVAAKPKPRPKPPAAATTTAPTSTSTSTSTTNGEDGPPAQPSTTSTTTTPASATAPPVPVPLQVPSAAPDVPGGDLE